MCFYEVLLSYLIMVMYYSAFAYLVLFFTMACKVCKKNIKLPSLGSQNSGNTPLGHKRTHWKARAKMLFFICAL